MRKLDRSPWGLAFASLILVIMLVTAYWRLLHPPTASRESEWLKSGVQYLETGQYRYAYRRLKKVLTVNPNNQLAKQLAEIVSVKGYPKRSLTPDKSLARLEEIKPRYQNSPYLKMMEGEFRLLLDQPVAAQKLHSEVNQLNPNIPHNWYSYGIAQRKTNAHALAKQSLSKALLKKSTGLYLHALADQLFYEKSWDEAAKHYRKAFESDDWRLGSKFGYIRSLVLSENFEIGINFAKELKIVLESNSAIVKKVHPSVTLVMRDERDQFVVTTGLTREQLIGYLDLLIQIAEQLYNKGEIKVTEKLTQSDNATKNILKFDIDHLQKYHSL